MFFLILGIFVFCWCGFGYYCSLEVDGFTWFYTIAIVCAVAVSIVCIIGGIRLMRGGV